MKTKTVKIVLIVMSAAAVVHLIKSIIEPRFRYDVFGFEANIWSYRIYAIL